ncbi:tRNA (adenine(22)-N(1))-methyltransferase [Bacillus sp. Marseille-P3661]|uniref:tRNA (adenine(22)-N(1))-methyltransferase n=1 Tax=Bacillus sp. Marseille-P3661 TaxID=1936234 RepID=UPI000C82155B|nr:tRNA (adenine(22)-N(1))-methyltransferase TrmK [Bacillus sp. Marseille-P3661]
MNELLLSKRLEKVASEIPIKSKLADIGSDHAYLPCYAILKGLITYAIAGEVNEGPYQSAKSQVEKLELNAVIDVRKGNGLEVIHENEVDVITIAGMGGPLISEILEEGKTKLSYVKRLILQPNIGARNIRLWLVENGWELINEHILEEDGKIYEILVAERGAPHAPYSDQAEAELLFGPFLMKEKNSTFIKKWTDELRKWNQIVAQLDRAVQSEENINKKRSIESRISMAEEVLR